MNGFGHKYRAVKSPHVSPYVPARTYPSKSEAAYALQLDLLIQAGEIKLYCPQVKIPLGADFATAIDFLVILPDGRCEAHEVKGVETKQFRQVRRLWEKYQPMPLRIVKRKGKRWTEEWIGKGGAA